MYAIAFHAHAIFVYGWMCDVRMNFIGNMVTSSALSMTSKLCRADSVLYKIQNIVNL